MVMKRSEKVKYIANYKIVQDNLNVCVKEQLKNRTESFVKQKYLSREYDNCGCCMKCERTLLQLDILGMLPKFSKVFNLHAWNREKNKYIGYVLAYRKSDYWFQDIYKSMIENEYKISFVSRIYSILYKPYRYLRRLDK